MRKRRISSCVQAIGELAQMVERPLSMREVPGSIPGFSKGMAGAFVLLMSTCFVFNFLLFLLSVSFPYLSTVTVTYPGRDSCPPALNHCTQETLREIIEFCCSTVTLLFHGTRGNVLGRYSLSPTANERRDNDHTIWKKPTERRWSWIYTDHLGRKYSRILGPWTLSAPRSEQFSESVARGKLFATRNR